MLSDWMNHRGQPFSDYSQLILANGVTGAQCRTGFDFTSIGIPKDISENLCMELLIPVIRNAPIESVIKRLSVTRMPFATQSQTRVTRTVSITASNVIDIDDDNIDDDYVILDADDIDEMPNPIQIADWTSADLAIWLEMQGAPLASHMDVCSQNIVNGSKLMSGFDFTKIGVPLHDAKLICDALLIPFLADVSSDARAQTATKHATAPSNVEEQMRRQQGRASVILPSTVTQDEVDEATLPIIDGVMLSKVMNEYSHAFDKLFTALDENAWIDFAQFEEYCLPSELCDANALSQELELIFDAADVNRRGVITVHVLWKYLYDTCYEWELDTRCWPFMAIVPTKARRKRKQRHTQAVAAVEKLAKKYAYHTIHSLLYSKL